MALSAIAVAAAAVGCSADSSGSAQEADAKSARLSIEHRAKLPLLEVSGLAWRAGRVLAIGDREPKVIDFDPGDRDLAGVQTHDVASLVGTADTQWEAIAADGAGKVFVMAEAPPKIVVFDDKLSRVLHTVDLVVPSSMPWADEWTKNDNSRGEGMVLLGNGHVLVAKEKDTAALVEFGPEGARPAGYAPGSALGRGAAFPIASAASSRMVALKRWVLKDGDRAAMKDISELAVDASGSLVLLSQESRAAARIERELGPDEDKIDIKLLASVDASVGFPEGMVFFPDGSLLLASDEHTLRDNLYWLKAPSPR